MAALGNFHTCTDREGERGGPQHHPFVDVSHVLIILYFIQGWFPPLYQKCMMCQCSCKRMIRVNCSLCEERWTREC
ncbi:hypothetical protein GQ55_1G120800 [Panicum hallii var. hallii]|uniref:Uncharacterized protein n=1 Tax=Panicum hallii var. hallii TaxID=1504633 RepID=A0A2T7F4R8_9POAL|nr:hypothetical protein GQ55_1G120800 [Panicum hallii var. hallii]